MYLVSFGCVAGARDSNIYWCYSERWSLIAQINNCNYKCSSCWSCFLLCWWNDIFAKARRNIVYGILMLLHELIHATSETATITKKNEKSKKQNTNRVSFFIKSESSLHSSNDSFKVYNIKLIKFGHKLILNWHNSYWSICDRFNLFWLFFFLAVCFCLDTSLSLDRFVLVCVKSIIRFGLGTKSYHWQRHCWMHFYGIFPYKQSEIECYRCSWFYDSSVVADILCGQNAFEKYYALLSRVVFIIKMYSSS